tara:strand:+ start:1745 stop:1912 length:168 start_codon:yes stop_codon:yes gene_type:complete
LFIRSKSSGKNLSASVIASPHNGRAGQAMAFLANGSGAPGFIKPILMSALFTLAF